MSWAGASAYADSFGRLCAGTVTDLLDALSSGETLIDVGTGTGTVLKSALARGWDAIGVDPAPEMLALATASIPPERLHQAALPDLRFPDSSFDAVTANFVINHLPDPRGGVRELTRLARPTGTVALTIWPSQISTMNDLWNRVMAAADVHPPIGTRLPPAMAFDRTPAGLADMCEQAGLAIDRVEEPSWTFKIGPDRLWRGVEGGIGVVGQTYLRTDAATRTRLEHAYRDLARPGVDGQLHLDSVAILAVGHSN